MKCLVEEAGISSYPSLLRNCKFGILE